MRHITKCEVCLCRCDNTFEPRLDWNDDGPLWARLGRKLFLYFYPLRELLILGQEHRNLRGQLAVLRKQHEELKEEHHALKPFVMALRFEIDNHRHQKRK